MFSRFKKKNKNEKKEDNIISSGSSTYQESTSVQQKENGTTITSFSRQESNINSTIQTSQHISHTFTHSSSAASFPCLPDHNLTSRDRNSRITSIFDDRNSAVTQTVGATSIFDRTVRPLNDATVFSFDPNSYASFRSQNRHRSPHLNTISSSSPRVNPVDDPVRRPSWNTITSPILLSSTSRTNNNNCSSASSVPNATNTNNDNIVPTYKHCRTKLGKVLIINNVKFMNREERQGAEKDSQDLENLFKKLKFEVKHKKNLSGKDMSATVKGFSRSSFDEHDISVVVMMSHGNNYTQDGDKITRVRGGFTQVAGIDHQSVLTDDIIDFFTVGNYHPSLRGKPKIFIFQCCRGEKEQEVHHDAASIRKQIKEYSDVLVAFSTLPGYLSNRDPKCGTWYIQSLCQVFEKYYRKYHIEDMLKFVDEELSNKHPNWTQTSTYENRGFKACYLHKNV